MKRNDVDTSRDERDARKQDETARVQIVRQSLVVMTQADIDAARPEQTRA